jgi:DNA polymerase-3 subunit epsilon
MGNKNLHPPHKGDKMILVLDFETTGLPNYQIPSDDPSQPYAIQLGMIVADYEGNVLKERNLFIKPDGWTISDEITKLTGITQEMCEKNGVPIKEAIAEMLKLSEDVDHIVAHNASFDKRIARICMKRLGMHDSMLLWKDDNRHYCTMTNGKEVCKIPATNTRWGKYKSPKLEELFFCYFGEKPEVSHDAIADVRATLQCFLKMYKNQQSKHEVKQDETNSPVKTGSKNVKQEAKTGILFY